jgi:AraC-like DNA-binding protein
MHPQSNRFWQLVGATVRFAYHDGAVTRIEEGHHIRRRRIPSLVLSNIEGYSSTIVLERGHAEQVRAGDTICIRPWAGHELRTHLVGTGTSRWSHTSFTVFGDVDVFTFVDTPWVIGGARSARIGEINTQLSEVARRPSASWATHVRRQSLGLELLALVLECSTPRKSADRAAQRMKRLAPALGFVSDHLSEPIYIPQIAALCGMSPSRFHAAFKEAMGISPGRHLQDLRLRKAQSLLLAGDRPIKTVAADVGYPDEFHFSRLFRARFGHPPSDHQRLSSGYRM